jgi:hypothetical protein
VIELMKYFFSEEGSIGVARLHVNNESAPGYGQWGAEQKATLVQ